MLREVDLNKNLTKKEYKEMMDKLGAEVCCASARSAG